MKYLLLIAFALFAENVTANDTTYFAVLRTSLELADREYTIPAYQNLANTCERIIAIKENDWLPLYYCAYAYANLAYMTEDEEKKDELRSKIEKLKKQFKDKIID